jgi:hypothetical protein
MNHENIKQFFENLYEIQIGEQILFKAYTAKNKISVANFSARKNPRKLTQLASAPKSKEEAQQIADSLIKTLPKCANVKVVKSRRIKDKYRAIIYNPMDIYADYAKKIAERLNEKHPATSLGEKPNYLNWYDSVVNNDVDIAFDSQYSTLYVSKPQKIKLISEYIERIKQDYEGLEIDVEEHKHGNCYLIEKMPASAIASLLGLKYDELRTTQHNAQKNKTIRIFDFDQTISIHHTFHNREHSPEDNIKSGVEKLFLHDDNNIAAIATYHNDPNYVKVYVEKLLGKTLTFKTVEDGKHHKVSVYEVQGEDTPLIISTLQPTNFNKHLGAMRPTGKNVQIMAVLEYLAKGGVDYKASTIQFYDDSENNFKQASKLNGEVNNIESYLVEHDKENGTTEKFNIGTSFPSGLSQRENRVAQPKAKQISLENNRSHTFFTTISGDDTTRKGSASNTNRNKSAEDGLNMWRNRRQHLDNDGVDLAATNVVETIRPQ